MASKRDYYEILGVSRNASSEDIKTARNKKVWKYHPDRNKSPDANKKTQEINEAYDVLSNPHKRRQYDDQAAFEKRYSGEDIFRKEQADSAQRENKSREEAERREEARQEEERLRRQREEQERAREKEEPTRKEPEGTSWKSFFAVVLALSILLGIWALAPPAADQKTFTNSIGMEFVQIPAGGFDMGSPLNEVGRWDNEGPVHRVKLANAFYIGKYEVTQKQWREVIGTDPSYFKGDNLPVEGVSWNDAQEFIKKLNEKEGTKYRLPSEAEWEYAARAGTTTRFSFGDDESMLGDYAWYDANSGSKTHEVGQKKPNPWGLYEMHGNVWEWVQDIYHSSYSGAPTDGSAWEVEGSYRVRRGGSWDYDAWICRSAYRDSLAPGSRYVDVGFRLLRAP